MSFYILLIIIVGLGEKYKKLNPLNFGKSSTIKFDESTGNKKLDDNKKMFSMLSMKEKLLLFFEQHQNLIIKIIELIF